jgi:hypothetical protein
MRGHLGWRALAAFIVLLAVGISGYVAGRLAGSTTLTGVGLILVVVGAFGAVGLLLRWMVYRRVR